MKTTLTAHELALVLGISLAMLRGLVRNGSLQRAEPNRFKVEEVQRYLAATRNLHA